MSLLKKFTIYSVVVGATIILSSFSLSLFFISENYNKTFSKQIHSVLNYFAQDLRESLLLGDHYKVYQDCSTFFEDSTINKVQILTYNDEYICEFGKETEGNIEISKSLYFDKGNELLAKVTIGYRESSFFEEYSDYLPFVLGSILIVSFLLYVSTRYLGTRFLGKISTLSQYIESSKLVDLANISYKVERDTIPEINNLIMTIEDMSKEIILNQEERVKAEAMRIKLGVTRQVSHDIKSPLVALHTLIKREYFTSEEVFQLLLTATKRIDDISSDLNDFKREQSDNFEVVTATKSIIDEKTVEFEEKNVNINFDVSNVEVGVEVGLNESSWKRIISNLINNSIEAGASNVSLEAEIVGSSIHWVISDNGKGIPQDLKSRIFNKGESSKYGNGGLGLYHAKQTLQEYKGDIVLNSSTAKGTKFEVCIPVSSSSGLPYIFKANLNSPSGVILFDDSPMIHSLFQDYFGEEKVVSFFSPLDDPLEKDNKNKTVVFCDFNFDGYAENAFHVYEKLRESVDSFFVISYNYDNPELIEFCRKNSICIVPKPMIHNFLKLSLL